jgi:hypothetical protein
MTVPYRIEKPYIILNRQRMIIPTATPQRLPFCDRCDTLAATSACLYTELPPKWWQWLSFPKFSNSFHERRVDRFDKIPPTRWQRLTDPYALVLAVIFAVFFAVVVGFLLK